jgi:hypothetical protein
LNTVQSKDFPAIASAMTGACGRQFVPLTLRGTVAVIHLTRGLKAIIDVADWPLVGQYRWHAHRGGPNLDVFYARRKLGRRREFLHNVLLPPPPGRVVDHEDLNRLNNRRSNLRIATNGQNMANRRRVNCTGFRGVRQQRSGGFQVIFGRKGYGTYAAAEEAARVYDALARAAYGQFAVLNFPA